MKKLIALLLALVMVLSLAACAKKGETADGQKDQSQSQNQNDNNSPNDNDKQDDADQSQVNFSEIVVLDNEECMIKITGVDPNALFGYGVQCSLENKSAEETYAFYADSVKVNGIQCEPCYIANVGPGEKIDASFTISVRLLELDGIVDFTDIELDFGVYVEDDFEIELITQATTHIYPLGEDKAVPFTRGTKATDQILVDNEYVKIIAIGTMEDDQSYNVALYMENVSDKNMIVSADEVRVNDCMLNPSFNVELCSGVSCYNVLNWFKSDLADNDISKVESIEFRLYATDSDDWNVDDYVDEEIIYHP